VRLARTVRSDRFTVTVDRDFEAVLAGCAESRPGRPRTWINARIRALYRKLYERRHCHSIEVYDGETLVGGLYGVTLGRAYFGESMFHRARDASKVALVHLVARLRAGGFKLLDTQFVTDHLRTFGAIEVPRRQYHKLLEAALPGEGDFAALGTKRPVTGAQALAMLAKD
jgi:leucyl/phenylalanyl-tRNA--protein transferase